MMLPTWTWVMLLVGATLALCALMARASAANNANIPTPIAGAIVVAMLAGGGGYVWYTVRPIPRPPVDTTLPPGTPAISTQMFMGGMGARPDPRRGFFTIVLKMAAIPADKAFNLTPEQRASLLAIVAPLANSDELGIPNALAWDGQIRTVLTPEQLALVSEQSIPDGAMPNATMQAPGAISAVASNPLNSGKAKDLIEGLVRRLGAGTQPANSESGQPKSESDATTPKPEESKRQPDLAKPQPEETKAKSEPEDPKPKAEDRKPEQRTP